MDNQIIYNAYQTPDGTIIHSKHRHDYVSHVDANGEEYMVDGGNCYVRRSVNREPAISLLRYSNEDHEIVRQYFHWGTYGKNPDINDPDFGYVWIPLEKLSDNHIKAILDTQKQMEDWMRDLFTEELEWRTVHHVYIEEVESYE